jgi:prepilin-type N-terminal cleavage/methylation domain-containing protein
MQHIPMSRGRRGFTMIELLVALVLLGLVSTALYRVLVNNQRLYMAQTQRIDLSQNIRAAGSILPAEFRELDASEGDITAMSATSISIRAMRWLGFACNTPVLGGALNPVSVIIRGGAPGQQAFFGARDIDNSRDSVLIYYDGNQTSRLDDFWALGSITAAPNGQNCDDGSNGQRLLLGVNLLGLGPNVAGAIPLGAPVRGFERVTYQLYQPPGDTSWYVGFQPAVATSPQPLIGPVLRGNGLQFQYYDVNGNVTAVRSQVARIDITVRARTAAAVRGGGQAPAATVVDSVVTSVALRNNRRF